MTKLVITLYFYLTEMELSRKFSHFFQIKAKNASQNNANGNDEQPIFTLSGAQHSRLGNELQQREHTLRETD